MRHPIRWSCFAATILLSGCIDGVVTADDPAPMNNDDSGLAASDPLTAPVVPPDIDGGGDGAVDSGAARPDAAAAACSPAVATSASGQHNAGLECMVCHGAGGGAPRFTLGGTLYVDAVGSAPVVGATVQVIGANGARLNLVTARNGNFWATQAVAYPVKVVASRCPTSVPMITAVAAPGGCNAGGCHGGGMRIHLP